MSKTNQGPGSKILLTSIFLTLFLATSPLSLALKFLAPGTATLANPALNQKSSHSLNFTTQTDLQTDDLITLKFPNFSFAFADPNDCQTSLTITGPKGTVTCQNAKNLIKITLTENFSAGPVTVVIAAGKIQNPNLPGQYSISIATQQANQDFAVAELGLVLAKVKNFFTVTVKVAKSSPPITDSSNNSIGKGWTRPSTSTPSKPPPTPDSKIPPQPATPPSEPPPTPNPKIPSQPATPPSEPPPTPDRDQPESSRETPPEYTTDQPIQFNKEIFTSLTQKNPANEKVVVTYPAKLKIETEQNEPFRGVINPPKTVSLPPNLLPPEIPSANLGVSLTASATNLKFDQNMTLNLSYSHLADSVNNTNQINVYRVDSEDQSLVLVNRNRQVNSQRELISVEVDRLGEYLVLGANIETVQTRALTSWYTEITQEETPHAAAPQAPVPGTPVLTEIVLENENKVQLHFSEPVTSPNYPFYIFFEDGQTIEIPAWEQPRKAWEITSPTASEKITYVAGEFFNQAGSAAETPLPLQIVLNRGQEPPAPETIVEEILEKPAAPQQAKLSALQIIIILLGLAAIFKGFWLIFRKSS